MVDWYMIGVAIIVAVMLILGNIYYLAYYAHPNDTPFGKSIKMRIMVVKILKNTYIFNLSFYL